MTAPALPPVRRLHDTLPIFCIDEGDRALLYTPGDVHVTTHEMASGVEAALKEPNAAWSPAVSALASALRLRGQSARDEWAGLAARPFAPECLTLYLSNRCNLACSYCYSAPDDAAAARNRRRLYPGVEHEFPLLDPQVAFAAARLVATHCADKARRLTMVVHGGGEPTLHWDLLVRVRVDVEHAAQERGILTSSYIATNGVMPEDRARWLGRHFSMIGLSCDGPPDMQNANRATGNGGHTSDSVERTARVFADIGCQYSIRATIVPETSHRQRDIVAYACDRLGAKIVRFEPAYSARRIGGPSFQPADAERFVEHYLEACEEARSRGCDLQVSGVRMDEIHGPYCNVLREVLQLSPDGVATGCFLNTSGAGHDERSVPLGRFDAPSQTFIVDQERTRAFRQRATRIPVRCESCVNIYHCARDCPDVCPVNDPIERAVDGFRCRVQKLLGIRGIRERAAGLEVEHDFAMMTA